MPMFLVSIQDKEAAGEPDIAVGVTYTDNEADACRIADSIIAALQMIGKNRCVVSAREIEQGRMYRTGSLISLPAGR